MKKWIVLAVGLLLFAGRVPIVKADEVMELKQQLAEQSQLLQQMQQRLNQLEVNQNKQNEQMESQIARAVEEKQVGALPDSIKWVENVKISGDLRYRHESIDAESNDRWKEGRHRHRVRARIGIEGKVNDECSVGIRLASGSADPASTNQTLADSFSSKDLWLDLAYFDWHPLWAKNLNLIGGKMKNPFYKVGKNQLIWDGDLNPEGVAAKYVVPFGDADKLYVNVGGFWVDESSGGVDTSLWAAQTYLKHIFKDKSYLLGGVSYFDYGNIKGRGDLKGTWSTASSFFGNTSTSASQFASDYDLVEAFGEYGFKVGKMPVTVFGNYVQNISASTSKDTGWLLGFKLNKAKKPGSWEASYNYRDLEADAVLGAFCDSDFVGGGTDGKGHKFGFKYQIAKNLQGGLTYLLNEAGSGKDDYRRLQADLVFKF